MAVPGSSGYLESNAYRFAPDETYLPVDVFLDKPIEPDTLVDTINELLGERREEPKYPL
jgi:hypothetical protein